MRSVRSKINVHFANDPIQQTTSSTSQFGPPSSPQLRLSQCAFPACALYTDAAVTPPTTPTAAPHSETTLLSANSNPRQPKTTSKPRISQALRLQPSHLLLEPQGHPARIGRPFPCCLSRSDLSSDSKSLMVVSALECVIFVCHGGKETGLGPDGLYQDLDGNQLMIKMIWH